MRVKENSKRYRLCAKCGFFTVKDSDQSFHYCTHCGSKLQNNCANCKLEFDDPFAKYCKRCGAYIQNMKK